MFSHYVMHFNTMVLISIFCTFANCDFVILVFYCNAVLLLVVWFVCREVTWRCQKPVQATQHRHAPYQGRWGADREKPFHRFLTMSPSPFRHSCLPVVMQASNHSSSNSLSWPNSKYYAFDIENTQSSKNWIGPADWAERNWRFSTDPILTVRWGGGGVTVSRPRPLIVATEVVLQTRNNRSFNWLLEIFCSLCSTLWADSAIQSNRYCSVQLSQCKRDNSGKENWRKKLKKST